MCSNCCNLCFGKDSDVEGADGSTSHVYSHCQYRCCGSTGGHQGGALDNAVMKDDLLNEVYMVKCRYVDLNL